VTSGVLGIIPARLGSTRLPRKPLHLIQGRPLLEWVWMRARNLSILDDLVIATDADEVLELCARIGARGIRTDPGHPSGTDRLAEVAERTEYRSYPILLNIQGDEPLVPLSALRGAVALVQQEGGEVGSCATPVRTLEAWLDPNVVKVVRASDGRALYFSRAPIPHLREGLPSATDLDGSHYLRHLGIYAYRREALLSWVALPPSPLEQIERLEQLRALQAGLRIDLAVIEEGAPGVDTPEDAERVASLLMTETFIPPAC
jgi:3-deoxy-manno-octulosonate cytidylyltransferase (CMP-KDO synthetase)